MNAHTWATKAARRNSFRWKSEFISKQYADKLPKLLRERIVLDRSSTLKDRKLRKYPTTLWNIQRYYFEQNLFYFDSPMNRVWLLDTSLNLNRMRIRICFPHECRVVSGFKSNLVKYIANLITSIFLVIRKPGQIRFAVGSCCARFRPNMNNLSHFDVETRHENPAAFTPAIIYLLVRCSKRDERSKEKNNTRWIRGRGSRTAKFYK